ncbi:MAG: HD domain-containing protein [Lachnospiraceae bacterium]|nr:HD domain-containing protein [Lachnospiraceae bacterium]
MKCLNESVKGLKNIYNHKHMLQYTLSEQLIHGCEVSNLACEVARELQLSSDLCSQLAVAGLLHDIGKIQVLGEVEDKEDTLVVEEMSFVRMHAKESYEIVRQHGYSVFIQESILYHHENFDGSGYPYNFSGLEIPLGARILRVCDVYCALTSDRPYRRAFDTDAAMELMIDDIKDFDMRIFLAFQRVLHEERFRRVRLDQVVVNERGEIE